MNARVLCLALLATFLLQAFSPPYCFAELHKCNGIWSNSPCEGGIGASLPEKKSSGSGDGEGPFSADGGEEEEKPSLDTLSDLRRKIYKRKEPRVVAQHFVEGRRVTVAGTVVGQGRVKLVGYMTWTISGPKTKSKRFASKKFNFHPMAGGSGSFKFHFSIPSNSVSWNWKVDATNDGPFEGYYDLTGCCSFHGGITQERCSPEGRVQCADRVFSPTCRCGG